MEKMRKLMKKPLWLLSILVVFVTVYSLVLPAITLDEQTANDAPDIVLNNNYVEESTDLNEESADKKVEEVSDEVTELTDTETVVETSEDSTETEKATDGNEDTVEVFNNGFEESINNNSTDDNTNNDETVFTQKNDAVKDETEESQYPAVKFSQVVNDSIIYVEAPEGAFKNGTIMEAEEVEDTSELEESINNDLKNSVVKKIKAIDIRFIYNEEEVEPLVPIKVSITSAFVENNEENALLMHIDDEGKTNEVKQSEVKEEELEALSEEIKEVVEEHEGITEVSSDNTITFESDSFSVYAIVYVQTIQIAADGGTYNITVSYTEDAQIPEGSELNVREIEPGTVEYELYLTKSATQLNTTNENISFARFFDIEILKDGEKIEPTVPVNVDITFDQEINLEEGQQFNVVHFIDDDNTEVIDDVNIFEDNTHISYVQSSFSVTAIVAPNPSSSHDWGGNKYVLIVEWENNYYILLHGGTLEKADNNSITFDGSNAFYSARFTDTMLWNYYEEDGNKYLRHNSDAWDFWPNQLAKDSGIMYEYINPTNSSGITKDDGKKVTIRDEDGNITGYRLDEPITNGKTNASLTYDDRKHISNVWTNVDDSRFIGVELDSQGKPVRITGGERHYSNRIPTLYFATIDPNSVSSMNFKNHRVNHIDIGINATARLNIPLLKGIYYDSQGQEITITTNQELSIDKQVPVNVDDIKNATLSAYKLDNNGNKIPTTMDPYYITGYTGNAQTDLSYPQVRIEGNFLVADVDPYIDTWGIGDNETDNYPTLINDSSFRNILTNRLNNKVYYSLSTTKDVTFDIKYNNQQLYENKNGVLVPMQVTVPVSLSASFNYWDNDNECPGIKDTQYDPKDSDNKPIYYNGEVVHNETAWKDGFIVFGNDSGMDFVLGGGKVSDAIQIIKYIVSEDNERLSLAQSITIDFDVYENSPGNPDSVIYYNIDPTNIVNTYDYSSYKKTLTKNMKIGVDGMGMAYEMNLASGMVSIKEDKNDILDEITDSNGYKWHYTKTRIETEYVRRWPKESTQSLPNHLTVDFTKNSQDNLNSYMSVPEAVGSYTYLPSGGTQRVSDNCDFVEYYVYNYYAPVTYSAKVKKVDSSNPNIILTGAEFDLYQVVRGLREKINTDPISVGTDGTVSIGNLESGTYILTETKAPDGYNLLSSEIIITVDSREETTGHPVKYNLNGESNPTNAELINGVYVITVSNTSGMELPMTGGLGTEYISTIGGLMMLVSCIIIIRRRYMA